MTQYVVPQEINYIAAFLTFGCQLNCSYCINKSGELVVERKRLAPSQWVKGLSRLVTRTDLPLTLQGGEPTTYYGFYELVQKLPDSLPLDLLTNIQFDIHKFIANIKPSKFGRSAPYAPIRVSYHRETMHPMDTIDRLLTLQKAGFNVGVFAVDVPDNREHNEWFQKLCVKAGLDFRWKEYLAKGHGTYKYPQYTLVPKPNSVMCRTSEILIDPAGNLFRCHSDLYSNINIIGSILDKELPDFTAKRVCNEGTSCNGCDTKIKNSRFQVMGATAVTIDEIV